jgi:hypothetical protein
MQSSSLSSKSSQEGEHKLLTPHEYIRDSFSFRYRDCVSCGNRTEFTCVKCGYCYSCHWKKEQDEAIELRDNHNKDFYVSLSKTNNDDRQKSMLKQTPGQGLEKWTTLDVLGHPAEPICTYYGCHHQFSLHGSRRCRCKHPMNKVLGIQVGYC